MILLLLRIVTWLVSAVSLTNTSQDACADTSEVLLLIPAKGILQVMNGLRRSPWISYYSHLRLFITSQAG